MSARFGKRFTRLVACLVTLTLITGQTGCLSFAYKESASSEQAPGWNRVGVTAVAIEPRLDARDMPRTHDLLEDKTVQGAAVGGAGGAGVGAAACLAAGPYAAVLCPFVLVAYTSLGLTLGGAVGTLEQDKDDAEQAFAEVPTGTAIQVELKEKVMAVALRETSYEILDLGAHSPTSPPRSTPSPGDVYGHLEHDAHSGQVEYAEPVTYALPREKGIDAVLEVNLRRILARGMAGWKGEFRIELMSRSRLIRASDGHILANRTHYYTGPAEQIGANAADQKDKIRRSIRIGIETLAHDIVAETLLGGGNSAHSAASGLPEFVD